jgi:hypothetical protein
VVQGWLRNGLKVARQWPGGGLVMVQCGSAVARRWLSDGPR